MQIELSTVKNKRSLFSFIIDNKSFLISVFFLLVGIFAGAFVFKVRGELFNSYLEIAFAPYFETNGKFTFFSLFFYSFTSTAVYLSLIFIFAFGVCGLPLIPTVLFFRGLGTSAVSCVLYNSFMLKGVAYFCLILLPPMLLFDMVLVGFSSYALELSSRFLSLLRDISSRGILLRPSVALFLKKTAFCLFAAVISSLLETVLCKCLSGFFEF